MAGSEAGEDIPDAHVDRPQRRWASARVSIVLLVVGVGAMVVPGLLRDGLCGLITCADVTPEIAVGRPGGSELAIVVPEDAASTLRSLRLFPITDERRQEQAGSWIVYRTDDDAAPTTIELGVVPEGFTTDIELANQPAEGLWVIEASFGCAARLVRFAPVELDPGFVTTGERPEPIGEFTADARSSLRCATEAPGWQRVAFFLGALAAFVGAALGIVVVFRRPIDPEPDWYQEPDDLG